MRKFTEDEVDTLLRMFSNKGIGLDEFIVGIN